MLDHLYLPEPVTFVTVMTLVILLACGNYVIIWFQNRKETALLWMAVAALASGGGLFARAILSERAAILLGIPAVLLGIGCIWTGCRVTMGRRPYWPGIAASLLAWPVIAVPAGIVETSLSRSVLSYAIATTLLFLALREVLSKRWPRRPGHWFMTLLLGLEALICALWGAGQMLARLGWLAFDSAINIPFSAFTITGFNLAMSYAFVAWVKEDSERAHAADAYRDALTGIGNRRRLDEELTEAVAQARRRRHPLAVIMIDIDRFKAYNDRYGHPAGDACLRAVATCVADAITHPEDEVMRYGGEEFTVLLRRGDMDAAYGLAERMRLAVRAMKRPHADREDGIVTISLGVVAMPAEIATAETLVAAADRALYRAKEAGRDRSEVFTPADSIDHPLGEGRIRVSDALPREGGLPPIKI
jgi:diguanylate cyclase (GGDEF)-like protein